MRLAGKGAICRRRDYQPICDRDRPERAVKAPVERVKACRRSAEAALETPQRQGKVPHSLEQQPAVIETSERVKVHVVTSPVKALSPPELMFERHGERPRRGKGS